MKRRVEIDPESPWAAFAEEQAASAEYYSDISNLSGLAFREAQQQAFESYLQLEEGARSEALGKISILKRSSEEPSPPDATMYLQSAAGVTRSFPRKKPLPATWFGGEVVTLHFEFKAGRWRVCRQGAIEQLDIDFYSHSDQHLGRLTRVGSASKLLPTFDIEELSRIEISVATDNDATP
jgi:hypothetical protein